MVVATEQTLISVPEQEAGKEIKPPPYPRGAEKQFEQMLEKMTEATADQFFNQTVKQLNKSTIKKFQDAQSGNYASVFVKLASAAKRKLRKRFNRARMRREVTRILKGVTKGSQKIFYASLEDKIGVSADAMIKREGLTPQYNALVEETIAWVEKNADDTLAYMTNNTLRMMAEGSTLEEIESGYKLEKSKRVNDAKFIARNQLSTYNGMQNKIRYQKLGIQQAKWVTAQDERVRKCHAARNGKVFDLSKGLHSSCDGKTLQPGQDYNCRCIAQPILPGEDEDDD